jgi:hypothetical protein
MRRLLRRVLRVVELDAHRGHHVRVEIDGRSARLYCDTCRAWVT